MKYLQTHPIHEDFNPIDNPHKKHADSELKKTHANADAYAGAGEQPKKPVEGEHRLAHDTIMKDKAANIAGQNGVPADSEQRLSDKGEKNTTTKSIAGQNGSAATDDEQKLSDIAESRIVRFTDFN
jgi:hypothetical protein